MSKILDRERQFDSHRRARLEPPLSPAKELQEPAGATISVVDVDPPQQVKLAPALAIKSAVETPPRWRSYLLISILLLPFFAYLLREPPKPNALETITPTPTKQTASTRSVPPTLRFSAVGAIHEPKKASEPGLLLLPPTLRLLGVSSPLDLVPAQPFVRWEKTEVLVLQMPQQEAQPHPPVIAAISDSSQLAAVSSTLRALKLMDTAIANAKRVAEENKKPGD